MGVCTALYVPKNRRQDTALGIAGSMLQSFVDDHFGPNDSTASEYAKEGPKFHGRYVEHWCDVEFLHVLVGSCIILRLNGGSGGHISG